MVLKLADRPAGPVGQILNTNDGIRAHNEKILQLKIYRAEPTRRGGSARKFSVAKPFQFWRENEIESQEIQLETREARRQSVFLGFSTHFSRTQLKGIFRKLRLFLLFLYAFQSVQARILRILLRMFSVFIRCFACA